MKNPKGRHSGEPEEILRCQERNLVKQKYCVSEIVDTSLGREIMAALKPGGGAARKPHRRDTY